MKIAFYIADLSGGGAERVFVNLANQISLLGHNVTLLVNNKTGPYLQDLSKRISLKELNANTPKKSVFELRNYIIKMEPDAIYSTLTNCNLSVIFANLLSGFKTKVIVREANSFFSSRRHLSSSRIFYERIRTSLFYRLASFVVVNSEGSKSELQNALRLERGDIKIIYNSVDIEKIVHLSKSEIGDDIVGFLNRSPFLLASGRLEVNKGFDLLISAFDQVKNKKYKLVILGEGSHRKKLREQIDSLNLSDRVMLAGFRKNPYPVIREANLFVLSSRFEGMPNVLIEALILNKQIVATDCPSGPKELLKNGKLGKLVPSENVEKLKDAIEVELDNLSCKTTLIDDFEMDKFSIETTTKQYLGLVIN